MAFEVSVPQAPTYGANPWIDSLVSGGAWADNYGGAVQITYSVVYGTDPYDTGMVSYGYMWLNSEIDALQQAMRAWEAVASVEFVGVNDLDNADIWYWKVGAYDLDDLGLHELPGFDAGEPLYGLFNFQGEGWSWSGLQQGGFGAETLIHELGHGLGLAHEPPRVCRRLFGLSYAAMRASSSVA